MRKAMVEAFANWCILFNPCAAVGCLVSIAVLVGVFYTVGCGAVWLTGWEWSRWTGFFLVILGAPLPFFGGAFGARVDEKFVDWLERLLDELP